MNPPKSDTPEPDQLEDLHTKLARALQKTEGRLTFAKDADDKLTDSGVIQAFVLLAKRSAAMAFDQARLRATVEALLHLAGGETFKTSKAFTEAYAAELERAIARYEQAAADEAASRTKIHIPAGPFKLPPLG